MQVKNSFDSITRSKIFKSFLLTVLSAVGALVVATSNGVDIKTASLVALGTFGAWMVNTASEYKKGQ